MSDKYLVPRRLDDPELIGLWTLDEFLGLAVPFGWDVLSQHILLGLVGAGPDLLLFQRPLRTDKPALVPGSKFVKGGVHR